MSRHLLYLRRINPSLANKMNKISYINKNSSYNVFSKFIDIRQNFHSFTYKNNHFTNNFNNYQYNNNTNSIYNNIMKYSSYKSDDDDDDNNNNNNNNNNKRNKKKTEDAIYKESKDKTLNHDDDYHIDDLDAIKDKSTSNMQKVGVGEYAPKPEMVIGLSIPNRPFFPGVLQSITIDEPEIVAQLRKEWNAGRKYVGLFLKKEKIEPIQNEKGEIIQHGSIIKDLNDIYSVGTLCEISRFMPSQLGTDSVSILFLGHRRLSIKEVIDWGPPMKIKVDHWDRQKIDPAKRDLIRAYTNQIIVTLKDVIQLNPLFMEAMQFFTKRIDASDPYGLADFAVSMTTGEEKMLQEVLEEQDVAERLSKALIILTKERDISKLQIEIQKQVEESVTKRQREFMLHEQLKSIKKELGLEKDDKETLITKYNKIFTEIKENITNEEILDTIEEEINKLEGLEKNSAEFNVTRTYLDWLTSLPWSKKTEENFDLHRAKDILDNDHYGLQDVKERILQFIAVNKLKGTVHGKIVCFVGPPGVGKTSIGISIARSLNRKFYRFSVGGLSDPAELKGHRRTYVGAMPGKIIQCLKQTQSENPLILIDEIDKLGKGWSGDPSSVLLEILDPEQNSSFRDHYLDVPIDLSKVLFICTANVLDTIPGPLRDRMEIIQLSGYDIPEKVAIAKEYLLPKSLKEVGLKALFDEHHINDDNNNNNNDNNKKKKKNKKKEEKKDNNLIYPNVDITDDALTTLVQSYCREAGVRNLEKHIEKISRKLALKIIRNNEYINNKELRKDVKDEDIIDLNNTIIIDNDNLQEYVGKPIWLSDKLYDDIPPPGVVMGLAWTSMGGAPIYIESTQIKRGLPNHNNKKNKNNQDDNDSDDEKKIESPGTLLTTGQLGDVMKESTRIAFTYAKKYLSKIDENNDFFYGGKDIHMHMPEGATPKDGPSAGVTMVTALLSLFLNRSVRSNLAMTGELSLTGKVLPVGGIKEKVLAARRSGVLHIILPDVNKRDFDELPEYLKEGLNVYYAHDYEDVYKIAFDEN